MPDPRLLSTAELAHLRVVHSRSIVWARVLDHSDALELEVRRLRQALMSTALYKDGPYYYCVHCQAQGELVCSPESVVHEPDCIVANSQIAPAPEANHA